MKSFVDVESRFKKWFWIKNKGRIKWICKHYFTDFYCFKYIKSTKQRNVLNLFSFMRRKSIVRQTDVSLKRKSALLRRLRASLFLFIDRYMYVKHRGHFITFRKKNLNWYWFSIDRHNRVLKIYNAFFIDIFHLCVFLFKLTIVLQLNRKKVSKVKKEIHKIQRRFAPQVDVTGVTTDLLPFFAPFNL